ncbi:MAG: YbhB/YbcL family Raf kinase inhibitor-like protein [Acidimicrobiia bacterium]
MRRLIAIGLLVVACSPSDGSSAETVTSEPPITTTSTSTSTTSTTLRSTTNPTVVPPFGVAAPTFTAGEKIPSAYTCDGADVSPELNVVGLPENTESVVVALDDPDAAVGTWHHWVEFDIVPQRQALHIERAIGRIGVQSLNSWHLPGYGGPCPPPGEEHRYIFTVYALDQLLGLPAGVDAEEVYAAMDGLVIDSAQLMGVYSR